MPHRKVLVSACALAVLGAAALRSSAGVAESDLKEQQLYRLVSAAHRDTITMTSPQGSMAMKEPNTVITMSDMNGKLIVATLMETGGGPTVVEELKAMKPGDYAAATFEAKFNVNYVKSFRAYKMFDGEAQPNVFAFVDSAKREQGADVQAAVQLYKLGKLVSARVPSAKDAAGKPVPDPNIMAAVSDAAKGDVVEVEAVGAPPVIKTFAKYVPPVTGVVAEVKLVDVEGGKTTALELTVDGSTREFLVPGKVDAKGTFQPDAVVTSAVKHFQAKDRVAVKYRTDGGKDYVRDVARAANAG